MTLFALATKVAYTITNGKCLAVGVHNSSLIVKEKSVGQDVLERCCCTAEKCVSLTISIVSLGTNQKAQTKKHPSKPKGTNT